MCTPVRYPTLIAQPFFVWSFLKWLLVNGGEPVTCDSSAVSRAHAPLYFLSLIDACVRMSFTCPPFIMCFQSFAQPTQSSVCWIDVLQRMQRRGYRYGRLFRNKTSSCRRTNKNEHHPPYPTYPTSLPTLLSVPLPHCCFIAKHYY